jgi:polyisoprenoid-binding protein YceI
MRPAALLPLCFVAAAAAQPAPTAQVFTLDPDHSFVHFEVLHFGTSTIRGRIGPVRGTVTLDRERRGGELGLAIDTATVDMGHPIFNARIKQADLLAVEAFPQAYFVATRFRFDGDKLAEVRGEFTLRGVSQPLSLFAQRFSCRQDGAEEVCGGDFEGQVLRSDFGASYIVPLVANRVRLLVQVEGRRPASAR